ncbi:hypothetical protein JR316_0004815 [Psilocybe cubensis]|uniref:Uncharacterized protein n=2 Tax=Psilocybe cubensis TaxID=181762 RepID=A0A8H8CL12_PSICU|nr:hypothetical protein JR316_0004815 [Psilocybe cubensis]KAH9482715.1 hypothetical protein JR316_0004815 [Psilocybe cubensis]
MQRNMSYRKPVPAYIPSPPPSPHIESPFPSLQVDDRVSTEPKSEAEKPFPPLPENWREILAEKVNATETATVKSDIGTSNGVHGTTRYDDTLAEEQRDVTANVPSSEVLVASVTVDKDQESFTTIAACYQPHSQAQRIGRGLPTIYRPPTPPLRSHNKQVSSDMHNTHGVYLPNTSSKPYQSSVQLKPSSSFRTDRTMVSMNTTNYSIGWPNGQPTSSSTPMYSYPTLLIQKRNIEALKNQNTDLANDPNDDDAGCLSKACWPKFDGLAKRLRLGSISRRT